MALDHAEQCKECQNVRRTDRISEYTPDRMPEYMQDRTQEWSPDRMQECMLGRMSTTQGRSQHIRQVYSRTET